MVTRIADIPDSWSHKFPLRQRSLLACSQLMTSSTSQDNPNHSLPLLHVHWASNVQVTMKLTVPMLGFRKANGGGIVYLFPLNTQSTLFTGLQRTGQRRKLC